MTGIKKVGRNLENKTDLEQRARLAAYGERVNCPGVHVWLCDPCLILNSP